MAEITREQYLARKSFYDNRMNALAKQNQAVNKIVKAAKREKGYEIKRSQIVKGDRSKGLSPVLISQGKKGTLRISGRTYPENGGDGKYKTEVKSRRLMIGFGGSAWQDATSKWDKPSKSERRLLSKSGGGRGSSGHSGG